MAHEEQQTIPIARLDLVKQLNCAAVYQLIDLHGPISRIQIAELSQLAPASVTKITRLLLERKLIKEVEQQASTGGRRATSITTVTHRLHVISIRLGRRDSTFNLFDLSGKKLAELNCTLPTSSQQALQKGLIDQITSFITNHHDIIQELIAISIILPGLIDPENGVVNYMPHINVNNWPLAHHLEQHFSIKTFVDHDIRSLALAEHYFGATQSCSDSLLIRIERGVGAGIMIKNHIFMGVNGNVGEIGHIQIDPLGERCHCGNFGCLETITANPAVEQRARQLLQKGYNSALHEQHCDIQAICQAANQHDPLACELIHTAGTALGKAIAIAINLFNPQKIVIAGIMTQANPLLFEAIQQSIEKQALKDFREHIPIVISPLDHNSAIGAFALVKQAMLEGSLLHHLLA